MKAKVKIIAALVNPLGDDVGKKTVRLINRSDGNVNLEEWAIADSFKPKYMLIRLTIAAGEMPLLRMPKEGL